MKKLILTGAVLIALQGSALAQKNVPEGHNFQIGLAANNYFTHDSRVGVSGEFKWLFPTSHQHSYRFLLTAKASHVPPSNGSFFRAFDKGLYDNISSLYLMAGYRMHFDEIWNGPSRYQGEKSWFAELNAGASYTHHYPMTGFTINPKVGYSLPGHFEIFGAYQGTLPVKDNGFSRGISLVELGIAFTFKRGASVAAPDRPVPLPPAVRNTK